RAVFGYPGVLEPCVVGLHSLLGLLHRARRESYLAAPDRVAVGELQPYPLALDGIAILDRHLRMLGREEPQLRAGLARVIELARQFRDQGGWQHAHGFRKSGWMVLCLASNTS